MKQGVWYIHILAFEHIFKLGKLREKIGCGRELARSSI